MELDVTQLTYLDTTDHGDGTSDVRFVCLNFVYTVRCLDGIIQFIKGQRPEETLFDGGQATEEQIEMHDERRELYNGDHAPLQEWLDSL